MKVLITGSGGYLGQNLKKMLNSEYKVIDFDYALDKAHDIRDEKSFEQVVINTKPDVCIHLAAIANLNHYDDDLTTGSDINIKGSKGVLDVCKRHDCRVIFASTCCCYGDNRLEISNEESVVCPTEPYSKSKRAIELEILNRKCDTIICRLATFYGSKLCRRALATSLFIEKIYNGEELIVHGSGKQHRTYTHVHDMCTGFKALVDSIRDGRKLEKIYNITQSDPISVIDIIKEASKNLGKPAIIKFGEDRTSQFNQLVIENKRLRSLGWTPKYSFEEGMKEMVKSFLEKEPKCKWIL